MRTIMTLVGTRPELIKMSRVIAELDNTDVIRHVLVHTGQNHDYTLNEIFFEELSIRKPDYFLGISKASAITAIADVLVLSDQVFEKEKPDALLLYGDTNSCLAIIAAKRRKIPIFHMEAGNRCFDARVPEELNRKVVDHLSDINMVLTEHARRYLINEGIRPETIIKTGSHMSEVLKFYQDKINASTILEREQLKEKQFFVVSAHREENVDSRELLDEWLLTLESLAKMYGFPILVSTHPRTQKRLNELGTLSLSPLIRFLKPFGFLDYIKLQSSAFCVLSDSGTITEESSLLGFPAVMIRNAHERPEGMDVGTVIMSGLREDRVLEAISIVTKDVAFREAMPVVSDYANRETVSRQVVRVVLSYIDYVHRTVWFKGY